MDEKNIFPLIQTRIKSRVSKVEELSAVVFFFFFTLKLTKAGVRFYTIVF